MVTYASKSPINLSLFPNSEEINPHCYMTSDLFNTDCLDYMKSLPDKSFDLSIADPPFGVSYARGKNGWGVCDNRPSLDDVKWDSKIPDKEFFDELLRVSESVIIWGGNYYTHLLPVSKCWIVWDKCDGTTNKSVFADAELAWTNMTKVVRIFRLRQMGFISDTKDEMRIHPTQKPTENPPTESANPTPPPSRPSSNSSTASRIWFIQ